MDIKLSDHADDRAVQFLSSTFTLLALSWIIYCCRLYTRIRLVHRIFLEDYFITLGMAALTVFAAMVPVQTSHGGGKHIAIITNTTYHLPLWGRAFFIAEIMYLLTLCCAKLSMTAMLLRFSSTSCAITWTLRSTAAIVTGLTLAFIIWVTFQCKPVESQWDPSIEGGVCASKNAYMISVYVLSAFSAATDVVLAVVPVFVLKDLHIDGRTKVAAGVTLGLGSLACIATLVRFKFVRDFSLSEDLTYSMVPLSICSFIEVSLACICASLATLRPLLQKLGLGLRSLAGTADSDEEAGSKLWEGPKPGAANHRKNEFQVFAWQSEEIEGDVELAPVELKPLELKPLESLSTISTMSSGEHR